MLSAFPEFLVDYYGVKLWKTCVSHKKNPNNGSIYHYLDSFIKYSNECIVQKKIDDANILKRQRWLQVE